MGTIAALSQQQFLQVRQAVGEAIIGGTAYLHNNPLEADEKERAENIMESGFVDVQRVLNTRTSTSSLPLVHSVIRVPLKDQEMDDWYFVEGHAHDGHLAVRLIKSDYDRLDAGKWQAIKPPKEWAYVYPEDSK